MLLTGPYRPFWAYVRSLRSNAVALNSAYTIGSYVSLAVLQGLQFFLLARALGSHEFGIVASVVAITSAFVPFCSLGLGNVAIMHLTRGQARADESPQRPETSPPPEEPSTSTESSFTCASFSVCRAL